MRAPYDLWLMINMANLDERNRTTQELPFGTKLCIVKLILCVSVGRESTYVIVLRSKVYFVGDLKCVLLTFVPAHERKLILRWKFGKVFEYVI